MKSINKNVIIWILVLTMSFGSVAYWATSWTLWSLFNIITSWNSENWAILGTSEYRLNWANIKDGTVTSYEIQDGTLNSADLAADSIWDRELKNNELLNIQKINITDENIWWKIYGSNPSGYWWKELVITVADWFAWNNDEIFIWPHVSGSADGYKWYIKLASNNILLQSWYDWTSPIRLLWNVWIWMFSQGYKLDVNWTIRAFQYNINSDIRYKENISKLKNSLDKILTLNWYEYNLKASGKKDLWLIAQEVEGVYPELVSTDENGYKSVQYMNLVAPLIEAIKEQQKSIEILKKEVETLKNK